MMNYILLLIFSLVFHNESASQHFKDQYLASLKNPTNQTHRSTDYSSLPKTWELLTSSAQVECDLSDLTLTKLDCNDNNQFKVAINFAHQNTTTQFKLYINGEYKGLFPYSQLPITTDYLNGQTNDDYHFLIKDSEFPNCAIDGNISAPYCPDSECHLYNMTYEQSDCDSTGHFNMWLNCNHDNTSDFFNLYIDGGLIGQYAYSQLPINLTQLVGDGAFHVYKFIDINNGDCKVIKEIKHPNCSQGGDCHLYNMTYEQSDCDSSGHFNMWLNCNHDNTSDFFDLYIDGGLIGQYAYSQLPINLTQLAGDGAFHVYKFIDIHNGDCKVIKEIKHPNCSQGGDCHLYNMTYEQSDCDASGHFNMWLNCNHDNTSDFFDLYIDGGLIGQYAYSQLPINLTQLAGDGAFHVYKFIDINNGDCKVIKEIKHPNCSQGGDCHLYDMTFDMTDCDSTGHFNMWLNCNHDNTSDFFDLYIDGGLIGQYAYSQLPINLTQLVGDGAFHVYKFIDINNGDCKVIKEIKHPNCSQGGDCHLYNMTYEQSDCDSTGHFNMWLNCNHDNTSDFFDLYIDGGLIGQYAYSQLPINLTQLVGDGAFHVYKFIDINNGDCKVIKEIKHPNCSQGGECHLYDMTFDMTDCDSTGHFNMWLNCNHDNTSDFFDLYIDGGLIGQYAYSQLPINLTQLVGDGAFHVYKFIDIHNGDCKVIKEIKHPNCSQGGDCHLYNMTYEQSDCDSTGHFNMWLNCNHDNTSDFFNLYIDGGLIGQYAYSQLPINLTQLVGDGAFHVYKFIDINNGDCKVIKDIKHPNCSQGGECNLSELTLTPSNCNSEGQFYVEIDFDYENTSDSFKIQRNGHNYGYFSYEDLPIVLGPFDGNSSTVYEFLVKDQANPNCKIASHINPPYCQNGFPEPLISMEIYDFKCIDTSNYTAFINVEIRGDANIPVNLYESNKLIGEYNSSAFPIKVNLSKELLPSVKASDKNQPSNYTARLYQHPDCLLGTSNNISSTVKCFPNPTKSGLNLEWSGHHFQYRIHSINGNFIASGQGDVQRQLLLQTIFLLELISSTSWTVRKI
jgi:hypothetical protein